jgi:DNA-binding response OmpR family regulator
MRPKKKILLIDADETRCSVRSFVLANRGFRVFPVANAGDARRTAAIADLDLVMLCWPFERGDELLNELRATCAHAPSLVIAEKSREAPAGLFADAILLKGACSQPEVNERARVMCARKRGPRKGAQRKQPLAECAAAIATVA